MEVNDQDVTQQYAMSCYNFNMDRETTTLPETFIKRLKQIVPANHYESILTSFGMTRPTAFRVNTIKTNREDLLSELRKQKITPQSITWYDNAFIAPYTQRDLLTNSTAFNQGRIYIQSLSSLLAPLVLNPHPGEEILDLAAAPGGKTCQIACMIQNNGRIAAVEKSKSRFYKLKNNVAAQQASCVHCYLKDGGNVWRSCENRFDKVLLDAPCSSEARFNTNKPKSFRYWSDKKITEMARKQWRLIYSAFRSLKPGGTLVYSTCSFAPEENELIIHRLLKRFKDCVKIEAINLAINNIQSGLTEWEGRILSESLSKSIRILPNELMPGFFICRMKKLAPANGL